MLSALRNLFARRSDASPPATPAAGDWRRRGNEALARGDLQAAAACYLEGTRPEPGDPFAWLNLAYAQLELSQHDAARDSLRRAEALFPRDDPALTDVRCLVGRERQERGEWAAAAAAYRRAVERTPSHELAWRELGQVYEMQGDVARAEDGYTRALALRGDFDLALRDLARLLLNLDREAESLPWLERLVQVAPSDAEAHVMHGHALWKLWRLDEALQAADRALALGDDPAAMNLRGMVLTSLRRPQEALACHRQALAWKPDYVPSMIDAIRPLARLHRYDEGLELTRKILAIEPGRREALVNRGALLLGQLRCAEALEVFERDLAAEADDPDIAFHRSFLHLLLGDYAKGWPGYEARWQLRHHGMLNRKPDFGAPQWQGEPLAGRTLLLYSEQGLGDSIQSMRFLAAVARDARKVWLAIQPALWPVLGRLPANCELLRPGGPVPPPDFACPLMSLPVVLGTTVDAIPADVPYLFAPAERLAHWRGKLGPATRPRVGLAWSGNPAQANDPNRSMPLEALRRAAPEGCEYISLQKEVREGDREALAAWAGLRHFGDELESFGDTAALASLVDVVVSVDTSVAHLAGALARPLSVVLAYCPDWRWLLARDDSPWYPTAKLYRQEEPGEWGAPLARAMAELQERAAAPRFSAGPASA